MRIALVNPTFTKGIQGHGGNAIPLNLCYLASFVRKDNNVKILDASVQGWSHSRTVAELIKLNPDLIGITTTTPVFDDVIELTKQIRLAMPSVKIVAGGPHVSALPYQSIRESELDQVVTGEGELAFKDIIGSCTNFTVQRELIDNLDTLPFPARDLVDNRLYSPPPTKRISSGLHTLISSSRGCPFSCGFCATQTIWGHKTRYRSVESVIQEIEECKDKYGIDSFSFTDELFTANQNRVLQFCHEVLSRELKIKWVCSARAQGLGFGLLKRMKEAGCVEISFGIESGDERQLLLINKHLKLREASSVVNTAQRTGLVTHTSYIIGYEGETVKSIKNTIRYAKRLNTDYAAFFIASPLPGTPFYTKSISNGWLRDNAKWSDYSPLSNNESVINLPTISNQQIRKWHRKAIRGYYLRLGYILARIRRFRGWYELVNIIEGFKLLLRIK